jgi:hypothetical protein
MDELRTLTIAARGRHRVRRGKNLFDSISNFIKFIIVIIILGGGMSSNSNSRGGRGGGNGRGKDLLRLFV